MANDDERNNLWHFSLASAVKVGDWLIVAANFAAERDSDKLSDTPAVLILGGFVFPVMEKKLKSGHWEPTPSRPLR